VAKYEIAAVAKVEGKQLARRVFQRAGRRRTIPFTEGEFAEYLATMFEAGAPWALDGERRK
jgi:hypothetical protein